ncbi:MAG: choice-of-anchor L domain-containing protein, partial [Clostridia bacterium]|nr:choice-of-anchor L domain-containing protein [Clostridia bacterium]
MRRLLSIFVVMAMLLSLFPSAALAQGSERQGSSKKGLALKKFSGLTVEEAGGLTVTDMMYKEPPEVQLTPEDLVKSLVSGAVYVDNVKFTGALNAAGLFQGGTGIIGFEEGIILSSGSINNVVGPNEKDNISKGNKQLGDNDLDTLIPGYETEDAAVLEFDFIPTSNYISFQYVFASDEYNEFAISEFNDVLGFFVNGKNVALLPETDIPVSINNINGGKPFGQNARNPEYYINNDLSNGGTINTEMDGLTTVLNVQAEVYAGQLNHIKLAIADAGDSSYDSNVFIKAGSFIDQKYKPGRLQFETYDNVVSESIYQGLAPITVIRTNGTDGVVSVVYRTNDYDINNTASADDDYTPVSGTLVFEEGETSKTFFVSVVDDVYFEGNETVSLSLTTPQGGAYLGEQRNALLTINDYGQIQFSSPGYSIAENGGSAPITVALKDRDTQIYEGGDEEEPIEEPIEEEPIDEYPMVSQSTLDSVYEEPDTDDGDYETVTSVIYSTGNGTAIAEGDYSSTSGIITFGDGELSKTFLVPIKDDGLVEGNETVNLAIYGVTGGPLLGVPNAAVLTIIDNDSAGSGGGGGGGSSSSYEDAPDGSLIDRMPGSVPLSSGVKYEEVKKDLILDYDSDKLKANGKLTPRGYYWHRKAKKWVALASYPAGDGKVKVINDGDYKGWFKVFGVIEPSFTDIQGHWAQQVTNRMNGLGMIEGYPGSNGDLVRPARLDQSVTRTEFVMFLTRLLNINPDEPILVSLTKDQAEAILREKFK